MEVALIALSWTWVVATAVPLVRHPVWWVRAFEFPRAQIAALALLTGVLLAIFGDLSATSVRTAGAALLAAVLYQAARMIVYTTPYRDQVLAADSAAGRGRIRLITCNVWIDNRDVDAVLECVRRWDPDVFLAVECDDRWDAELSLLAEDYPYSVRRPQDNTYGMALYSRLPLVDAEVRFLRRPEIPSIRAVVSLPNGVETVLYGLHPEPPYPRWADDTAQRDAELLTVAREAADETRPVIVLGDLNDVAWSRTTRLFQRISGLLDPRIGRSPMNTFPANRPFLRFPLDHVFLSSHFKLVDLRRLEKVGSDHFPLLIDIRHEVAAPLEHEEPQAAEEDEQEAEEMLQEANERLADEQTTAAGDTSRSPSPGRARAPQAS